MNISMYSASVPVFRQMLNSLNQVLARAEAHATAKSIAPDALLLARLYPDMFPLRQQVQIAADFAKNVTARLAQSEVPADQDNEQSFAELRARVTRTLAFIDSLPPVQFEGSEQRQIVVRPGTPKEKTMSGHTYLLHFGLPQFFFHVTTAYAILRHNGVEIGKRDFLGSY